MRLETCIRKGLRLKSHRVREVREETGRLVAEIEWIMGRTLTCWHCSRRTWRVQSRQPVRECRDLSIRDQPLVLRYAPTRVHCLACGPRVEAIPWAHRWQRITRALAGAIARLARQLTWKETAAQDRESPCQDSLDGTTVTAEVAEFVENLDAPRALRLLSTAETAPA